MKLTEVVKLPISNDYAKVYVDGINENRFFPKTLLQGYLWESYNIIMCSIEKDGTKEAKYQNKNTIIIETVPW